LPITVYLDGSGTHGSDVLTLAACVLADDLLDSFNQQWREAIKALGLQCLHMRTFNNLAATEPEMVQARLRAVLNVCGQFRQKFFYIQTCSVLMDDYAEAKRMIPLLATPEELCVNFVSEGWGYRLRTKTCPER
jgi:hypothetical protein